MLASRVFILSIVVYMLVGCGSTPTSSAIDNTKDKEEIALTKKLPAVTQTNNVRDGVVQVGRYSSMSTKPEEVAADPLSVLASINFPRQYVKTIGDAMNYTLMRTGYRMVGGTALDKKAAAFLMLPLPESQRQVGTWTIRNILHVLLGTPWDLKEDPLTRQIWFQIKPEFAPAEAKDAGKNDEAKDTVVTQAKDAISKQSKADALAVKKDAE